MGRKQFLIEDLIKETPSLEAEMQNAEDVLAGARLVRLMREQARMSQEMLATKLNVAQSRISKIEKGDGSEGITFGTLRRIARICGFDGSFKHLERSIAHGNTFGTAVGSADTDLRHLAIND